MENILKKEGKDLKEIFNRIKKRDFSGNTGIAIKNSVYQITTNVLAKVGSMIFTILLARLLMPEVFGLYSLALSTIIIFSAIADLGINQTMIRFVSKEKVKKKNKIKSYLNYLGKIKIYLVIAASIALIVFSKIIASQVYQKPIFLALLAGVFYILFTQIINFLQSLLQASNNFLSVFKGETIFQISRIIFVPLAVILIMKLNTSSELKTMITILTLASCFLISSVFLFFKVKESYKLETLKENKVSLSKKEKNVINRFIFATTALVLSGVFFGNVDRVMLGRFVQAEFIGYYTAAYSLIGALIPILGFASMVLFPIFSRLKGEKLQQLLKKSIRLTLLFSILGFFGTLILAKFVVGVIYGASYSLSVDILKVLSLLLLILPLAGLYQSYLIAQGKPNKVAKLLIASTILNILLNGIFIVSLIRYSPLAAVYGAAIATIISQLFYLIGLIKGKTK